MNANPRIWHRGAAALSLLAGLTLGAAAGAADDTTANDTVKELTTPQSQIEVGAGGVSSGSYKFGEYNGLQDKGVFGVGNIDLRGGGAYDSPDTTRWRLTGRDLGLDTRSLNGEYGQQGRFRVTLGFDELRRNRSDSYMTPYLGSGTAVQTLPSTWIVPTVPRVSATAINARGLSLPVDTSSALVNGVLTAPTAAQLANSNALIAADVPLFGHHNISTRRSRYEAGLTYELSPRWEFVLNAKHEKKDGAKPMGSLSITTGGDISAPLADPIDQTTDQLTASLAFRTRNNFLTLSYYGSRFANGIESLTWTNWAAPNTTMSMSSAPGNQSHQWSAVGGHDFSSTTRLVVNAAYTNNIQNATFLRDSSTVLVPVNSLGGQVVTSSYNLKLTSRPVSRLSFALDYKHDLRNDRTAVHTFGFYDANIPAAATNIDPNFAAALGVPAALLKSNVNINANRPYGRRLDQLNADADLHIGGTQSLKAGYQWQEIDRWCNATWIDCADAAVTHENTGSLEWRASPLTSLNARLGYTYANRSVGHYNENAFLAIVPLANVSPSAATGGATAYSYMLANGWTGYGPVAGYQATTGNLNLFFPLNNAMANATYQNQNRISELPGMRRYNMADRTRNRVRGNLDWQPTESASLQGSLDFTRDNYADSRYGLLATRDWALNLEGTYNASENFALTVFYTHEDQHAQSSGNSYTANSAATSVNGFTIISGGCYATVALRNASNKIDPCLNWSTDMTDQTNLYGLSIDRKNLLAHKLELGAELVLTRARSDNGVAGGNYANNPLAVAGAPAGTIAAFYIPAAALPTVSTDSDELRIKATYALSSASTLRAMYLYGRLVSSNYTYDGMQYGGLAGILPSNETAPHYTVHVIALSYAHRF